MSRYREFVEHIDEMTNVAVNSLRKYIESVNEKKFALLDGVEADILKFKETGELTRSFLAVHNNNEQPVEEADLPRTRGRTKDRTVAARSSSLKENSREPEPETTQPKSQRKAFVETSQLNNINSTVNITIENVNVKVEKLSQEFYNKHSDLTDVQIKQEKMDMPPPTKRPIRQTRKRKGTQNAKASNLDLGSVQVKEELIDMEAKKRKTSAKPVIPETPSMGSRESDVQITPEPVDTIDLVESDEEDLEKTTKAKSRPKAKQKATKKDANSNTDEQKNENEVETTRVTRTKTRNAAKIAKQESVSDQENPTPSSSTENDGEEKKSVKRTKTRKGAANKKNEATFICENSVVDQNKTESEHAGKNNVTEVQEETQRTPPVMNETIVLSKATLNITEVIEHPKSTIIMNETISIGKMPNGNLQQIMDEIMTDDEDTSPPKPQRVNKVKQVFSPYASSPVKKRVEAFEKLGAETNTDLPPRMTRTKTKAKQQATKEEEVDENEVPVEPTSNTRRLGAIPKLKTTPSTDNRVKLKISQTGQFSGLKASQAEFRERELRRKQKEEEALSKKEALIQAQTEERRRKREERQLKAQQTREAIEKDKQKIQESLERQKQEKSKQIKAEKEEKLLKQKEEAARKRALVMKKAAEEKQKEEERRKLESRLEGKKKLPPYLLYETPLLPTEDCYDSDDSNANKPLNVSRWQKKDVLLKTLRCMRYVESHKRKYFNTSKTVNLKEIFPSIEPHKLKRTSSAIWNRSGISTLSSMAEED